MTPNQIVFLILAAIAVFGAMGVVVFGDKPVWSALSLVLNFLILALIYFTLGNQFLGITQIMVYAGAIMVLFLFVIMILKLSSKDLEKKEKKSITPLMAVLSAVGLGALIFTAVIAPVMSWNVAPYSKEFLDMYGKPQALGSILFSQYVYPFEIAGILLTIGVIGSILLAKRRMQ